MKKFLINLSQRISGTLNLWDRIGKRVIKISSLVVVLVGIKVAPVKAQAIVSAPILEALQATSVGNQITQWLNGIDQLYGIYEQIVNNIEMIEQQYEQMQFYVDRAAHWNFEEIQWDGDLDFRDEIRNATSQVNRQLTNIRKIKNSLTAQTISVNGEKFSLASLCGIDDGKGGGNMSDLSQVAYDYYYKSEYRKACEKFAEDVPEKDAIALWNKYGLTPANYKMVKGVEEKMNEHLSYVLAVAEENILDVVDIDKKKYEVIEQIMNMYAQEGLTETEAAQLQGMLQLQNFNALKDIEKQLRESMSLLAWAEVYKRQQEEAEKQSRVERLAEQEANVLPSFMY